jgi:predicted nucleic acid-binding protein
MKPKVYIETSVISYLTARASRDVVVAGHQQATQTFWERLESEFDPFVSSLVVEEAERGDAVLAAKRLAAIGDFPVIENSSKAEALAGEIIKGRGIPKEYPEDALHIALAAMAGMNFVVTWNFSHINNPFTRTVIRQIVENAGYSCPELVSPDELLGEKE